MRQSGSNDAAHYQKNHRKNRIWKTAVMVLSSVVVFCTTYALILPAITMNRETICGIEEHIHTEECYQEQETVPQTVLVCSPEHVQLHTHTETCYDDSGRSICGYADFVLHTHDEGCYDNSGVLVCGLPEIEAHTHDESCYAPPHSHDASCYSLQKGALICTTPEGETHVHTDACFASQQTLVCSLEEIPAHHHTADCYVETSVLVCSLEGEPGHVHDEACYTVSRELSCGKEETDGHTHSDACYQMTDVQVCGLDEETPHAHADACFAWESVLTCTQLTEEEGALPQLVCDLPEVIPHIHDETCFDADGSCICGLLQVEEHVHDSTCFAVKQVPAEAPVFICGKEEHQHSDACYPAQEALEPDGDPSEKDMSGTVYDCGLAEHLHSEDCYSTETGTLLCTMTQHLHNDACAVPRGNPDADVEIETDWEVDLPNLSGVAASDLVAVAESQLGYEESDENYLVSDDGELLPYSRYSVWWDSEDPYGPWDAKFVAFCLYYAGFGDYPVDSDTAAWLAALRREDLALPADATPIPGDLAFLDIDDNGKADHVVIVVNADTALDQLNVIGERRGAVRKSTYTFDTVIGWGRIPGNEPPVQPQAGEVLMPEHFFYENEWLSMVLTVDGIAFLPEDMILPEDGVSVEPVLQVNPLDEDSDLYWQLWEAAEQHGEDGGLLGLNALELQFLYCDVPLDTSACTVMAELTLKEPMLLPPMATYALMAEDIAPEAETGVEVAVLQTDGTVITSTDTAFFETRTQSPVMTVFVTDNVLAVSTSKTANPSFTVEYYAYLDQAVLGDSGPIPVINTDNNGTNAGGKLPQNGVTPDLKYLTISNGKITTSASLEKIYQNHQFSYIEAPNLTYFNRLYENDHYALKEIWVKNAEDADWTQHPNAAEMHFTNREASVDATTVLIKEGTIIRLVYDTSTGSYDNAANFYDYDITDSTRTSYDGNGWTGTTLFNTKEQGINSAGNYSGNGSKLAFGNKNTGTGLHTQLWNGNELNKFNSIGGGYGGCTFGLARSLVNGNIQYASGVIAPALFKDGSPIGKTTFGNSGLAFARNGDTYTLISASGENGIYAGDLDLFTNPNGEGYTNNFWPLDGVTNTVDPHFGDPIHAYYRANGTASKGDPLYAYKVSDYGTPSFTFPRSDNGQDHNNYFGLDYAVNFNLSKDYVGPLEYLFFGDDDMWVFLTDPQGNSRLVCDIGGVHSSVGEYVNLWDYIQKDGRTEDGTYTLSFFYTERGASGSSCYMQFTLPSVSSATPEQTTGTLRVEKEVSGAPVEQEQEYEFTIKFTDTDGKPLQDDYAYTRYNKNNEPTEQDIIISSGGSFKLRDGEHIIVKYLPVGTKYTIQEAEGVFKTTVAINDDVTEGCEATGTIRLVQQDTVHFLNTFFYELPATGGGGTEWYTAGGLCLMAAAVLLYGRIRPRRKGGRDSP